MISPPMAQPIFYAADAISPRRDDERAMAISLPITPCRFFIDELADDYRHIYFSTAIFGCCRHDAESAYDELNATSTAEAQYDCRRLRARRHYGTRRRGYGPRLANERPRSAS